MINDNLFNSLKDLQTAKIEVEIFGSLGIPINGQRTVEVVNRSSYVYVRLRDNQNEVIQAFNDTVSPVYDLPVVLVRRGNKYAIKGRDTNRYQNWGTESPFLPRHGNQHSFSPESGGAGDVTFVYGKQFVPMLAIPSGTNGSGNVIVSEYIIQQATGWKYVGNTGTQNLLGYKPTGSSAVMVLVYVDKDSGNPNILVGSGSYFASSITGTAQVLPYLPPLSNTNHLADFAVRLVSGTSVIGWDNLYDVRQYFGSLSPTGSSGGSGTIPTFITGSVPFSGSDGILKENNRKFFFDEVLNTLWLGESITSNINILNPQVALALVATGTNTPVALVGVTVGTGTLGSPSFAVNGYRSRGTFTNPLPVGYDDALFTNIGAGYDGSAYINAGRFRWTADGDWITGTHQPTRAEWEITPSGSATRRVGLTLYGNSLNLTNTGTYNVNGLPHTHSYPTLTNRPDDAVSTTLLIDQLTQSTSGFTATIATLPGGAVLTYTPVSGNEDTLVPSATTYAAKQRLYNTTRGTYGLISNSVVGTNTTTLTATVPAGWLVGDTITTLSPTVVGGGFNWVDFEIISGEYLNKTLVILGEAIVDTGGAGAVLRLHPFTTYSGAQVWPLRTDTTQRKDGLAVYSIISNVITVSWVPTGAGTAQVQLKQQMFFE